MLDTYLKVIYLHTKNTARIKLKQSWAICKTSFAYALCMLCMCFVRALHVLCTCFVRALHVLCMCFARALHMPCTYLEHVVYVLYNCFDIASHLHNIN